MDGFNLVYVDGHAKWLHVREFLAKSPAGADYQPDLGLNALPSQMAWQNPGNGNNRPPEWRGDWPLWGMYGEMATLR